VSGWWKSNMLLTCVMLWRRTELSRWWSATAQSSRYWCLITRVANAFILVTALSDDFAVHSVMLFSDRGSFLWCESVHYTYIWYICTLYIHTHTHTHPFYGPLSGTTRVSRCQKGKTNLDFSEARDSEWQWHQLGHASLHLAADRQQRQYPTAQFFTGQMPFLSPNQQRQSTEGMYIHTYKLI